MPDDCCDGASIYRTPDGQRCEACHVAEGSTLNCCPVIGDDGTRYASLSASWRNTMASFGRRTPFSCVAEHTINTTQQRHAPLRIIVFGFDEAIERDEDRMQ